MEDTELSILKIVIGFLLLIIYLAISWYLYYRLHYRPDSLAEAQAVVAASHHENLRRPYAEPRPPGYEDAANNQPVLRHRNSRENHLTSNRANSSQNQTEGRSNNQIANSSQYLSEGNSRNERANSSPNQSEENSNNEIAHSSQN